MDNTIVYTHVSLDTVKNIEGNEQRHKHELIDQFSLERFDAAQWAELFERAGAKFAGPVAWHGSGMLHWDSDVSDCNTVKMGPRIDLLGELKREVYARGMKLIKSVQLLGSQNAIHYRHNPMDLALRMPTSFEARHACVFKIVRRP